jgi:hypothetical protein
MEASRLRTGELIAAGAGIALFIIMFLPWFGIDLGIGEVAEDFGIAVPEIDDSENFNAWESFDFIDIVLFVTAAVAVTLGVMAAMSQQVNLPVAVSAITAGLGILASLLVIYRVLDPPDGADRKFGLYLGLIAALGVAYGGWRAMQEEGTSFGAQADRLGDRVSGGDEPPPPSSGAPPSGGPPPGRP